MAKAAIRLLAATLAGAGSFILASPAAQAHSQLLTSNPRPGAVLYSVPKTVMLNFDDDLIVIQDGNQIEVRNAKKQRVDLGNSKVDGATLSVGLKKLSSYGKYSVVYHVISTDGHPVTASYWFSFQKKPKN